MKAPEQEYNIKKRPPLLIALAVLQFLSPLGTILFNAMALGVKPSYVLGWILERPPVQIFEALFLMPIAGLAILRMKTWSYLLFFALMAWSFARNVGRWGDVSQTHSRWMLVLVYGLQVALALYFFLPSVRRVYLDARLRWWESKPRYPLGITARLEESPVILENLSEGGVFVRTGPEFPKLQAQSVVKISFGIQGSKFMLPCRVMYSRAMATGETGYGMRFEHDRDSKRRMVRLAKGLKFIGLAGR